MYSTKEKFFNDEDVQIISELELNKISYLKNANHSVAVFKIPSSELLIENTLTVALDAVRDPGNLGTIIRLCDWFGIHQLVCSLDTVDCYNPKVIQATMGSIARVNVVYVELETYIKKANIPVYGTCMNGTSIYQQQLPENAIIILGNEANGISEKINTLLNKEITIPRFGVKKETESLNVATATAIVLSEFKRSTEK